MYYKLFCHTIADGIHKKLFLGIATSEATSISSAYDITVFCHTSADGIHKSYCWELQLQRLHLLQRTTWLLADAYDITAEYLNMIQLACWWSMFHDAETTWSVQLEVSDNTICHWSLKNKRAIIQHSDHVKFRGIVYYFEILPSKVQRSYWWPCMVRTSLPWAKKW
jgi:hypothetical protein